MSLKLPLVTIITPVYNGAEYLEETIRSIKDQDYPCIEHIVIDDGSTDGGDTLEVLKKFPHVRCWTRPNRGRFITMNEGLDSALGEYVCFIHADDLASPGAVSAAVDFLTSNSRWDGIFGRTSYIDERSRSLDIPFMLPDAPFSFAKYISHVPHCSLYLRRKALIENKLYFDPNLKYAGDYDWLVRIHQAKLKISHLRDEFSRFRVHSGQTTQLKFLEIQEERNSVCKIHRVNFVVVKAFDFLYFFIYRFWELKKKYQVGGFGAVVALFKGFFAKLFHKQIQS